MNAPVHHIHIYNKPAELSNKQTDWGTAASAFTLGVGDAAGNEFRGAQAFIPPHKGYLVEFAITFTTNLGSPTDPITWRLHDDNAGIPGNELASGTFAPVASSVNTVNMFVPIILKDNATYWISWQAPPQAANNAYSIVLDNTDPYADGDAVRDRNLAGTWTDMPAGRDVLGTFTIQALSNLIARYPLSRYRHTLDAHGGDISMNGSIAAPRDEIERIYETMVGNRFEILVDNPLEPIFEGIIARASFSGQSLQFSRTLEGMANSVRASWNRSGPVSTTNTVADNTNSQSIYGILDTKLNAPYRADADTDAADALRDSHLARVAYPINTILPGARGGKSLIEIEGIGLSQTLKWDVVVSTTASDTLDALIKEMLDEIRNGTTFFNNIDQSLIVASTIDNTKDEDADMTAWDVVKSASEIGDGAVRFTFGIERTNPFNGNRRLFWKEADETVKHITYDRDQLRFRLPNGGKLVQPWKVRPDGMIRINDIFLGWSGDETDPRLSYLSEIVYDMSKQSVSWQSDNNTTTDGVFELGRIHKPIGIPFGKSVRDVVF